MRCEQHDQWITTAPLTGNSGEVSQACQLCVVTVFFFLSSNCKQPKRCSLIKLCNQLSTQKLINELRILDQKDQMLHSQSVL